MKRPSVSLTHFVGDSLALIVHGHATVVLHKHPDFAALEELQRASAGLSVRDWSEGAYLRVDAEVIYSCSKQHQLVH